MSSETRFVTVERDGDVAVIRIDRPKVNALNSAVLGQLGDTLTTLSTDAPRALLLWGGERIFAAGADITEIADVERAPGALDAFRQAFDLLARFQAVTIAAIAGYALGGGLELALCCDLRVAATTARLGLPELALGVIPAAGGTQRLARLVGAGRAKELVLRGRQVQAAEALAIGLVTSVVEPDELFSAARALAAELAAGPPLAQRAAKRAIDDGLDGPLAAGLDRERALMDELLASEDARTGLDSFVEHGPGKASFRGA